MEDTNKKITNTGVHVAAFETFIDAVKADSACALKFMKLPDDKCWFYRANLLVNKERVMVVLDTKAKRMDFIGSDISINALNDRYNASQGKTVALVKEPKKEVLQPAKKEVLQTAAKKEKKPVAEKVVAKPQSVKPTSNSDEQSNDAKSTLTIADNFNVKSRRPMQPRDPELPDMPYLKTRLTFSEAFGYASKKAEISESASAVEIKIVEPKKETKIESKQIVQVAPNQSDNIALIPPYDGYIAKNFPLERLERVLKLCNDHDAVTLKDAQTVLEGTVSEVKTYTLIDGENNKMHLRFLPKKEMLQLQGKKTALMERVHSFFNDGEEVKKSQVATKQVETKKEPTKALIPNEYKREPAKALIPNDYKREPSNGLIPNEYKREPNKALIPNETKKDPAKTLIPNETKREPAKTLIPNEYKRDPNKVVLPSAVKATNNKTEVSAAKPIEVMQQKPIAEVKTKEDIKKLKQEQKQQKNKSKAEKASEKEKSETIKKLHKLIPVGFDYLTDIAKKDLCSCLKDINTAVLSDYSGLLTPPYRALENLISSLQLSKGIIVKMIGQGFEKEDNGKYTLKSGYLKKINSIIFNEVMSALYSEYFSKRNFFSHSDNSLESQSRDISDKNEVKKIFYYLLEMIEYNCKKLNEIGAKLY